MNETKQIFAFIRPSTRKLLRKTRRLLEIKRTLKIIQLKAFCLWNKFAGEKIVVFHLSYRGQEAYISPVIRQMKSRKQGCCFLAIDERLRMDVDVVSEATGIAKSKIVTWDLLNWLQTIHAFITPTQWACPINRANIRVCMFHGQPSKGNTFAPELIKNFNTLFILGPLQRSLYESFCTAYPTITEKIKSFNVGYPKSDDLVNGCYKKEATLSLLGLPEDIPVVLYAPAYDPGTSLDMYGDRVVEELMKCGACVIVKLHPMHYNSENYPSGINWPHRLKRFENNKLFFHAGNQPIDTFLVASDVLVTDVSGVALEFMLLDKPVIFIDCPDFFQNTIGSDSQGRYIRSAEDVLNDIRANAGRSAGLVVSGPGDLGDAIKRSLEFPMAFSAERQSVRSQLLYNPGTAASSAADILIDLLG